MNRKMEVGRGSLRIRVQSSPSDRAQTIASRNDLSNTDRDLFEMSVIEIMAFNGMGGELHFTSALTKSK